MKASLDQIERDLNELSSFSGDGEGITRRAFTPIYRAAEIWLDHQMRGAGLETRRDAAGNLIGRFGPPGAAVVVGSHIDTVVHGGPLDGAFGVIAAIECARVISTASGSIRRPLEVVAFADEEGRFQGHLGSLAMAGALPEKDLSSIIDAQGISLGDAMRSLGLDIGQISHAERHAEEIHAYVELHIEQGPLLESASQTIGVVSAICGVRRTTFRFSGVANHAGATPQNLRQDAMLAAAQFMTEAEALVRDVDHTGPRLTFGVLRASPQVDCVIPDDVAVTCELRSANSVELDHLADQVARRADLVGKSRGVGVVRDEYHHLEPVEMSDRIASMVSEISRDLELPAMDVVSGAGHDAQSFAGLTEVAMIFVPSHGGRSHCPQEATDPEDLAAGANVLLGVLWELLTEDGSVFS